MSPDAVPTIEEVGERIGQYLDVYHRTGHRGLDGLTPLAVWSTAVRLRRAVGDTLAFLMDVRGLYKVGGNGVSLNSTAQSRPRSSFKNRRAAKVP